MGRSFGVIADAAIIRTKGELKTKRQRKSLATWYAAYVKTVDTSIFLFSTGLNGHLKVGTRVNGFLTSLLGTRERLEVPAPSQVPAPAPCQSTFSLGEVEESPQDLDWSQLVLRRSFPQCSCWGMIFGEVPAPEHGVAALS